MPVVLEYTTRRSVGRVLVTATSFDTAMTQASSALRGLQCVKATLLLSDGGGLLSNGRVIATYTLARGWRALEAG